MMDKPRRVLRKSGLILLALLFACTPAPVKLSSNAVFHTQDTALITQFLSHPSQPILWGNLLPAQEKAVISQYQGRNTPTPLHFSDQLYNSLQAANDPAYSAAQISVNTVADYDDQAISIPAFIVPIDFHEDRSLHTVFLVPYFGACIHFPPPPPNQIIFAQLPPGFTTFDIEQAYRVHGIMQRGLFEDPLGTSAYRLTVAYIEPYQESDHPDDVRAH